ncbi:peptidoglycan DD-metalloendopeptidase family protein [Limibaculum sp. M0105]|uniref:Peptidoglycan DD-metalloendopeptidase family protein n=2 Tax=Thermohalobaculum xanthum TaxID=2753746 RepID=A0A8J7M447_9RHOB|nr:peptidoglycan DD-metalloendopeptidase family protein [Thermohalobaculum xanthum]
MKEAYEARIGAMEDRQLALEAELNRANERRDAATARLSEKQQRLVRVTHELNEVETEAAALRFEVDTLNRARREAEERLERLGGELIALRLGVADAQASRNGLAASLGSVSGAIDRVIVERDFAIARRETLNDRVAELESEVSSYEDRQERLLAQLEGATQFGLSGLEKMFRRANVDLDRILGELSRDYSGSGGPFLPLDEANAPDGEADRRVASLMHDLEQVNLMRFAAERLPFAMPVKGGRYTSNFGPRRDPLRRRMSMHAGIDIAGPRGTPVHATADGVVTYAGRQRGYGIVVKIRHAFGFETVYAHLDRARVTLGQRVERGDLIADMGNTGRSTGTHLHYEVRIDAEPVNPMKFIEAARDVL